MRILTASLIDGENISPKYANDLYQVLSNEAHHGVSVVARLLIGNPQALGAWSTAVHAYHFQTRTHQGGRNAADHLIRAEALKLVRQGVKRFYLVSNDGGFAVTADLLHFLGCEVVGFGTALAAKQWQKSCDLFFLLGTDPNVVEESSTAILNRERRSSAHTQGDIMEAFSSLDNSSLPDADKTREALQIIYGSATQPPLLTNLLFLFLQHTFSALCLTEQDSVFPGQWSAGSDAEVLITSVRDPIISLILEQDPHLRTIWQAIMAFGYRCQDAYEQGRTAARSAFPCFPRHRISPLQREHLTSLEAAFRYHAAPEVAHHAYPGYSPEAEQTILLRWFRRGYFSGAEMDAEEFKHKNMGTK
jgi:hypothetical protein